MVPERIRGELRVAGQIGELFDLGRQDGLSIEDLAREAQVVGEGSGAGGVGIRGVRAVGKISSESARFCGAVRDPSVHRCRAATGMTRRPLVSRRTSIREGHFRFEPGFVAVCVRLSQ